MAKSGNRVGPGTPPPKVKPLESSATDNKDASPPLPSDQKLRPKIEPMPADRGRPPENGIGARIRFARNELAMSIEALARYTANFDHQEGRGISATTLLRYESGDPLPGARELRILSEAFDVPSGWLLLGVIDNAGKDEIEQRLIAVLEEYVVRRSSEIRVGGQSLRAISPDLDAHQRRRWIAEAKKPSPDK